jgi:hypothetical protein
MDQKFVYVVHNIKHLWLIMWHIFTNTIISMISKLCFSVYIQVIQCFIHADHEDLINKHVMMIRITDNI